MTAGGPLLLDEADVVALGVGDARERHARRVLATLDDRAATRELRELFEKALGDYRAGSLDVAEQLFRQCLSLRADDGPSRVWLERMLHERDHPGTRSLDGVWNMTTK